VLPACTDPYDTDFAHIRVHSEEHRIILADTQKLDFGGFLKGHVAQLMVESMREVSGAIVNLGGDIYTTGRDANGIPFVFGVYNPLLGDDVVVLPVSDGAIATSGTYRRVWDTRLGQRHHILDAHGTENPTTDIMSATVVLPDGYRADAYATVAVVLGSRRARRFLSERGAHYVCITDEGGVESSGSDISYIHENVSLVH
jgi:thiamine biosynthesis lipoprotein